VYTKRSGEKLRLNPWVEKIGEPFKGKREKRRAITKKEGTKSLSTLLTSPRGD
jgi:hypothetical protein